ncbi:uncharacterized protein [Littorina saxatilis]|uniref:uncharacterized protein n=1 Tax=Littorina saxatilis TaxID=31220 RepID=UPI0038B41F4F
MAGSSGRGELVGREEGGLPPFSAFSGVLLPPVHRPQKGRPVQAGVGPLHLELVPSQVQVQDGNPFVGPVGHPAKRLGHVWDLQDAYFHILVAPGYRHLLRFVWEGTVFEFRALPFGLSLAPLIFNGDNNTTCLAYLRHQGGTNSRSLSLLAEEILLWCQTNQVRMSVQFVPGKLNALADILSRGDQVLSTEWTIAHNVLQRLWARWDRPLIDRFATRFSARLPRYVSPFRDMNAFHLDAFTLLWRLLDAYAYPPTSLIPRVLAKYLQERPRLILVAPYWPTAPWFPDLRGLTHVDPLPLDLDGGGLLQPRSCLPHPRPESLCLTAWLLCAPNCLH